MSSVQLRSSPPRPSPCHRHRLMRLRWMHKLIQSWQASISTCHLCLHRWLRGFQYRRCSPYTQGGAKVAGSVGRIVGADCPSQSKVASCSSRRCLPMPWRAAASKPRGWPRLLKLSMPWTGLSVPRIVRQLLSWPVRSASTRCSWRRHAGSSSALCVAWAPMSYV